MDIAFLSQSLKELVLENDRVSLPGLGSFLADIAPAQFSQDKKIINPPFRRVFFRCSEIWNDGLLENHSAQKLGMELPEAKRELESFLKKFRQELQSRKSVELPGFGTMRATKEGNIFFVYDKGLDIYSDVYGLEPISIKALSAKDEKEVKDIQGPQELAFDDVMRAATEEVTSEPTLEKTSSGKCKKRKGLIITLSIIAVILLIILIVLVFREQIGGILENVLYTPEELEIISGHS